MVALMYEHVSFMLTFTSAARRDAVIGHFKCIARHRLPSIGMLSSAVLDTMPDRQSTQHRFRATD
jgi:hypothetical protein